MGHVPSRSQSMLGCVLVSFTDQNRIRQHCLDIERAGVILLVCIWALESICCVSLSKLLSPSEPIQSEESLSTAEGLGLCS